MRDRMPSREQQSGRGGPDTATSEHGAEEGGLVLDTTLLGQLVTPDGAGRAARRCGHRRLAWGGQQECCMPEVNMGAVACRLSGESSIARSVDQAMKTGT